MTRQIIMSTVYASAAAAEGIGWRDGTFYSFVSGCRVLRSCEHTRSCSSDYGTRPSLTLRPSEVHAQRRVRTIIMDAKRCSCADMSGGMAQGIMHRVSKVRSSVVGATAHKFLKNTGGAIFHQPQPLVLTDVIESHGQVRREVEVRQLWETNQQPLHKCRICEGIDAHRCGCK